MPPFLSQFYVALIHEEQCFSASCKWIQSLRQTVILAVCGCVYACFVCHEVIPEVHVRPVCFVRASVWLKEAWTCKAHLDEWLNSISGSMGINMNQIVFVVCRPVCFYINSGTFVPLLQGSRSGHADRGFWFNDPDVIGLFPLPFGWRTTRGAALVLTH